MGKCRLEWIDCLRGIGILLVYIGHVHTPMDKIIYGFHMPLFFMISGFLYSVEKSNRKISIVLKKSTKNYIVPYFALCFVNLMIVFLFNFLQGKTTPYIKYILGIIYSRGTIEWMPNCSPLWFLTCYFCVTIITHYLFKLNKNLQVIMVLLFVVLDLILINMNVGKLAWNIDTALIGSTFFYFGYKCKPLLFNEIQNITIKSVFMLCFGIIIIFYNEMVSFDDNVYGNFVLMFLGAILVCLSITFLIKKYFVFIPSNLIILFGSTTIFLMGFDYFFNSLSRKFSMIIMGDDSIWIVVLFVKLVISVICLYLYRYCKIKLHLITRKEICRYD